MSPDNLVVLASVTVAGALPAMCVLAAALRLRAVLARRLQRMEDALRVYNSANAELGRQLRALEERMRAAPPATTSAPEPASARPLRSGHLASRRAIEPEVEVEAGDEEFSAAELRLAQLLRSRIPALRAG
jgi:hypothetical protein